MEYKDLSVIKKNRNYFLKLLFPSVFLSAVIIIYFLVEAIHNHLLSLYLICSLGYSIFFVLGIFFTIRWTNNRIRKALKEPSPEKLISISTLRGTLGPLAQLYNKLLSWITPGWPANQIFAEAFANIYWGYFKKVNEELQTVNWQKLPPIYQSHQYFFDAINQFLDKKNIQEGIKSALVYYSLNQLPNWIPGRKWLYSEARIPLEIGRVIDQEPDPSSITILEEKFKHSRLILKPMIAWALEKAYLRGGEIRKADQMRAYLTENAPYCAAFARDTGAKPELAE